MLVKYKNSEQIEMYKGFVIVGGTTYANNEEKAREVGFKDLVIEETPEFDVDTEYLNYTYEDGNVITQKWEVLPLPEENEIE